jgi:hypothetical protein
VNEEQIAEEYRRATGKAPETRFPDDPDWFYRGTRAEREELRERMFDAPVVIEGQQQLVA